MTAMADDVLVSVIIPVYNVEDYLDRCVKSAINQTYRRLQIILVDDGSKDSSAAKCDTWALEDDRIEVIHKSNGGLSSARNAGLQISEGKYILFLDADDTIDKTLVADGVEALDNDGTAALFAFPFYSVSGNDCNTTILEGYDSRKRISMREYLEGYLSYNYVTAAWSLLYRADFIRKAFRIVPSCEDVYFIYENCKLSIEQGKDYVEVTSKPYYRYTMRDGSISTSDEYDYQFQRVVAAKFVFDDSALWDSAIHSFAKPFFVERIKDISIQFIDDHFIEVHKTEYEAFRKMMASYPAGELSTGKCRDLKNLLLIKYFWPLWKFLRK